MYEMETRGNKSSVWGIIITGMQNMELKKFEVGKVEEKNFVLDERTLCSNISSKQIDTSHMTEAKHRNLRVDEVTSSGKKLLIRTLDKVELYREKFDNLKLLMSLKDVLRGFGVY